MIDPQSVQTIFDKYELSVFVNNLTQRPYGVSYLWDGLLNCVIVEANNGFYDIGDVSDEDLENGVFELHPMCFYSTVDDMIGYMKHLLDDPEANRR